LISDVVHSVAALDLSARPLRRFGLLIGAILLAGGLWLWQTAGLQAPPGAVPLPVLVAAFGAALLAVALVVPRRLRFLYRAWMTLAFTLGWFTSRLLLVAIFALVVTPLGLLARLTGKRFLELEPDRAAASYWTRRDPARRVDHRKLS
jgi:drug/metabolite transporter (DMT)-like permease